MIAGRRQFYPASLASHTPRAVARTSSRQSLLATQPEVRASPPYWRLLLLFPLPTAPGGVFCLPMATEDEDEGN